MSENGFTQVLASGCLYTDEDAELDGGKRKQYRRKQQTSVVCHSEAAPKDFPQYNGSVASDVRRMHTTDQCATGKRFETTVTSIDGDHWVGRHCNGREANEGSGTGTASGLPSKQTGYYVVKARAATCQLQVEQMQPISIRSERKTPQIVNVCQTFRFPDNFITQNNSNGATQLQDAGHCQPHAGDRGQRTNTRLPLNDTEHLLNRSNLGGFFGVYRRHRNMHSQTSRTLLELLDAEQKLQQPNAKPGGTNGKPRRIVGEDLFLPSGGSESTIGGDGNDTLSRILLMDRKSKLSTVRQRATPRVGDGRVPVLGSGSPVPYFDRRKHTHSLIKLVDGGATMGGRGGFGRGKHTAARQAAKSKPPDHRKFVYEDALESPFVGDLLFRDRKHTTGKNAFDEEPDELGDDGNDSGADDDVCQMEEQDDEDDDSQLGELSEDDRLADACGRGHAGVGGGEGLRAGGAITTCGVHAIIEKLQDNVWDVCLEGIWDLMETAGRIDWTAQEKYITVINRKLIEFLKSPRTSLCRSACQVAGELFREAKSTKRPEFDEMVDILLCKTADPNRFIQKDANVALDKLVTYIPTSHTVRAISNRGTVHRNPLVRTATARLLVCICVVSGLDVILGTNANPRTRKTILSMLAKLLTDKHLETRKFGERLYRMLRKHKFFDEYFYKDMDSNLRANLKRVLKGI